MYAYGKWGFVFLVKLISLQTIYLMAKTENDFFQTGSFAYYSKFNKGKLFFRAKKW